MGKYNRQESKGIIIVGGGLVGMSLAIALAESGLGVTVIDREKPESQLQPEFDGRVSAIAWRSYKFLEKIGVWKFVQENAEPIKDIRVSEFGSGLFLHFDHTEIGDEPFGFIVENRHTRHALHMRAASLSSLKLIAPAEVENVDLENSRLTIKGQPPMDYELLIAADGKNSQLRDMAAIKCTRRKYEQSAIVCTIEHELPHMGLAHEYFIPTGPFAVLPLSNNRSSLVWTEPGKVAPLYIKMSEDDFNAEIAKRVKHLGKVKALPGRWLYPLELVLANEYVKGNFVLVGDAAHAIHPIAGQGVNLGFRDAELLTDKVTEARKLGLEIGLAIDGYENIRRLDNNMMIFATDKINRLFSNNILPLKLARDIGLGAVNQIPALRRFFMKYAAGKF
jgi:2-octaprenyl-6-methoxyphenol hydroxylase